jgi:MerR family transcriptional regulator, heat shock protein HspR
METHNSSKKPVYSIGTAARMLGIAVQTLRMYERLGLLLPAKSPGNQRLYSDADLERVRCIRSAIADQKIGIEGIRRLHSLIPCWDIVGCTEDDQTNCQAFRAHERGCWTYAHEHDICGTLDCRSCPVYELALECGEIKQTIINASRRHEHTVPS